MRRFRHRASEFTDLERELRGQRPTLSRERLDELVQEARAERRLSLSASRLVLVGGLTTLLVVALAAIGGFGQAASSGRIAAQEVKKVVGAPFGASNDSAKAPQSTSLDALPTASDPPGQDQYKPGCGRGDPNHGHTGPPGEHKGFPGRCPPSAPPPVTPGP